MLMVLFHFFLFCFSHWFLQAFVINRIALTIWHTLLFAAIDESIAQRLNNHSIWNSQLVFENKWIDSGFCIHLHRLIRIPYAIWEDCTRSGWTNNMTHGLYLWMHYDSLHFHFRFIFRRSFVYERRCSSPFFHISNIPFVKSLNQFRFAIVHWNSFRRFISSFAVYMVPLVIHLYLSQSLPIAQAHRWRIL